MRIALSLGYQTGLRECTLKIVLQRPDSNIKAAKQLTMIILLAFGARDDARNDKNPLDSRVLDSESNGFS